MSSGSTSGAAEGAAGRAGPAGLAGRRRHPDLLRGLRRWTGRVALGRKLAVALAALAVCSAVATAVALSRMTSFGDTRLALILLQVDLALFLLLALVVIRNLLRLRRGYREGLASSRLHRRLVLLFSLIALVPAIVVSVFSASFLNLGFEAWFSDRVRTAVLDSRAVAEAYLKEHRQAIRGDTLSMARDLERAAYLAYANPRKFQQIVVTQGLIRNLSEAYVFDGTGNVLARWKQTYILDETGPPLAAVDRAREGEVAVLAGGADDRVRAVIRLDRMVDVFLYVSRHVEFRVLEHIEKTRRAAEEYRDVEGRRGEVEVTFAMIYVLVGLLLLLAAVWVGQIFANRISEPVSALAGATERVGAGDLSVRIDEDPHSDEVGLLGRAFNRMAERLERQHLALVEANRKLADRRNFIETVLSGVSAGVIGLDGDGRINVANRSASTLLERDLDAEIGTAMGALVPEVGEMIARARRRRERRVEFEISLHAGNRERRLSVCLTSETQGGAVTGFVVTFDDITELIAAQRKAAWSDIARRIAHEIRNPLTPISLAAERLRRKYLGQIRTDRETFSDCTDTIIRHVGDIGRMVDEFSEFARMPEPEMRVADLRAICRDAVTLLRNARPDLDFETDLPAEPVEIVCDPDQIARVLTNLVQNAVDAVDGRPPGERLPRGRIGLALAGEGADAVLEVRDNGKGLPDLAVERLTEPYVTTREGGTGLGLAIVKKVLVDHHGELALGGRAGGGTAATVRLRRDPDAGAASGGESDHGG